MRTLKTTIGNTILVDDQDYPLLKRWKWSEAGKMGHPYTKINKKIIYLHQLVMGSLIDHPLASAGLEIDHIDQNVYNNQSENLRWCSHSKNLINSKTPDNNKSGFKGIHFDKSRKKWTAQISSIHLGRFKNKEDAINCRVNAAIQIYGEDIYHGEI